MYWFALTLFKTATDAAQTPLIADSQAKWIDFVQKHTEVTEIRVPKAA